MEPCFTVPLLVKEPCTLPVCGWEGCPGTVTPNVTPTRPGAIACVVEA